MQMILLVAGILQLFSCLAIATSTVDDEVRRLAEETISARTPEEKRMAVVKIGNLGRAAIPELRRLLQSDDWLKQSQAFNGIQALGPEVTEMVPDIIVALTDKSRFTRVRAASVLGFIGWSARPAVSNLITSINDDDLPTRLEAIVALTRIRAEPTRVVQVIIRNLDSPEDFPKGALIKKYSVAALGQFGENARSAVPKLIELGKTTRSTRLRNGVNETLEQIGDTNFAPANGFSEQLFAACQNNVQGNIKIFRGWQGANSRIETNSVHRVVSERDWADLWRRHGRRENDCPKIDFSKDMLVAIFIGRSPNTCDLRLERGEIIGGRVNLLFSYMASDSYEPPGDTQFMIIQLLRFEGEIQVESTWVRAMSDGKRHNQVVAFFPPLQ